MSEHHPTAQAKPSKPSDDYPLFPHATGRWAKKIAGKMVYFGPWNDPDGALQRYHDFLSGRARRGRKSKIAKPAKPCPDFPLFPHATKRWAKKIRGRMYYFGPWADPQAALERYQQQREDLHAGRTPRVDTQTGVTVRDLCNRFLTSKEHELQTGQLSPHSFDEYRDACKRIVETFGRDRLAADLRPADFEQLAFGFPATWGPLRRGKEIQLVRSVFRYASEQDLIDRPVKFGAEFKRPPKAVLRIHRAKIRAQNGARMFAAAELRQLVEHAKMPFKAMLLLAANTGFGNTDCGRLPLSALDLDAGWVNFPRPKTGIERRVPLWPETLESLREAIARRPRAKNPEDAGLVFLTRCGAKWVKVDFEKGEDGKIKVSQDDAISKELRKLVHKLKINRPGLGFYAIRHGFQTVGEETRDAAAVHFLMGHAEDAGDMSAHYREHISDERLRAVTEHVREWLFGGTNVPPLKLADMGDDRAQAAV
jgi:integrase